MGEAKNNYAQRQLEGIYALGSMYYQMGYIAPAERIFMGLMHIDSGYTPAQLGLALVKLERGLYEEAGEHFRKALERGRFEFEAKIGLALTYMALQQFDRAKWLISDLVKKIRSEQLEVDIGIEKLIQALWIRSEHALRLLPNEK